MGIDIEVNDRKSHFNGPLEMTGKGTGTSPFFEKSIVEVDPLLNLGKVCPSAHLAKKISFEKFEWLALLKIGARLDCPDSKSEIREFLTISIRDCEGYLSYHVHSLISLFFLRIKPNSRQIPKPLCLS
jgi:hypothetical protein